MGLYSEKDLILEILVLMEKELEEHLYEKHEEILAVFISLAHCVLFQGLSDQKLERKYNQFFTKTFLNKKIESQY